MRLELQRPTRPAATINLLDLDNASIIQMRVMTGASSVDSEKLYNLLRSITDPKGEVIMTGTLFVREEGKAPSVKRANDSELWDRLDRNIDKYRENYGD